MRLRFLKHSFSLLIALAVVATPGFAQQTKGDPSGDAKVGELNDAFIARQIALGKRPFDARADVFPVNADGTIGDGVVDVRDVLVFLQGLVGLLGPSLEVSKSDVGAPITVVIQPVTQPIGNGPVALTANVLNGAAGDVTGITYTIDAAATAAGYTIAANGANGATLTPPATGAGSVTTVTVTATPTGPGVANRPRTTAGMVVLQTIGHDQGGGGTGA